MLVGSLRNVKLTTSADVMLYVPFRKDCLSVLSTERRNWFVSRVDTSSLRPRYRKLE